jgi:predicted RNase H-like nuclease (RuvC/YqgF family)
LTTPIGGVTAATPIQQIDPLAVRPVDQADPSAQVEPETEVSSDAADVGSSSTQDSKSTEKSDDKKNESVAKLQEQIARLQKQLAQAREQLSSIQTSNIDEKQKGTLAAALQVQIAMLNTTLMALMMKLADAIANENGKILDETGGRLPPQT